MKARRLWNCYREVTDDVDDNTSDGKLFIYKTKIVEKKTEAGPQPGHSGDASRPT